MRTIEDEVKDVLPLGTGRFRYKMVVSGVYFFSEPMDAEQFATLWDTFNDHKDLYAVEYESLSEYAPGRNAWRIF